MCVCLWQSGFIDSWNGRYIQGNIKNKTTDTLLGSPYAHVSGAMGTELLVLGFLYDMRDHCDAVVVQAVELAVNEAWFGEAMLAAADAKVSAIVILAHMHVEDKIVSVILKAIRKSFVSPLLFSCSCAAARVCVQVVKVC